MKDLPSSSAHAKRARRKRREYSDCERRPWTECEERTLQLHIEFFGCKWQMIGTSMRRSPDSLRNKMLRMQTQQEAEAEAHARAWLKQLIKHLKLRPPSNWTTSVVLSTASRALHAPEAEERFPPEERFSPPP